MADYKEATATGEMKSWVRACRVIIDNPYLAVPTVRFVEEQKASLPDGSVTNKPLVIEPAFGDFSSPATTFDLIDPVDGSVIGSSSYYEIYVLLFSLYKRMAADRDAAAGV